MRPAVPGTLHTERVGRSHSMAGSAATRSTAGLVPRHTLVHCYAQDHMQGHSWTEATGRPTSLLVRVQLPHISSAADAELDVKAESLSLAAQEYSLRLTLPYCVNDEEGSAKFDATSHTMEISLPVVAAGTKRKQLLPPPQQQQQYAVPRARGVAGKMVKRRDMDDTVLHRDFKFLEGAERQVDAGRRQRRQWPTNRPAARGGGHHHHHHHHYPDRIPKKISIVRDQARRRGTELVILAAGMRKRQQNSSYYNIKGKILSWRVEWVFKVEDGTRAMITDERLDESVRRPQADCRAAAAAADRHRTSCVMRCRCWFPVAGVVCRVGADQPTRCDRAPHWGHSNPASRHRPPAAEAAPVRGAVPTGSVRPALLSEARDRHGGAASV
jgi:hypothetical protein